MSLALKKVLGKLHFRVPPRRKKTANENIQLVQDARGGPTPTPAVDALELELAEERVKRARLEDEYQRAQAKATEVKRKLEDEIHQVKELLEARERDEARKDASLQRLDEAMNEMHTQLAKMDRLLSERTTELNAAQAFLTRSDAISEAEVVGVIENLNTLISSASGALSSTWDQREPVPWTNAEEPDFLRPHDYFSNSVLEQIAARNPVAVNLAIQARLGCIIERVTSGWGNGLVAGALGEIYDMISTKESQAIASRWRTLTKRYTPHQESPQGEVLGDLARIIMITGTFSDFSEAMESVVNSAGTEIMAIIEATLQLDDTIKTKIASCDMSVYVVPPGATFDEERMANEFGEDGTEGRGERWIVAGTMETGLLQRSGNVEKVLLRPKVILERDLVESEGEGEK